jgi:hypothetical protein
METFNQVRDAQPVSQILAHLFTLGRQNLFSVGSMPALFSIHGHAT